MKIALQELKQLIRESIQEEIQKEGIVDTVKGFLGARKPEANTPQQKPVDQKKANYFPQTPGHVNFHDKFLKWAEKEWNLYRSKDGKFMTGNPEQVKQNINGFLKAIQNSGGMNMDRTMKNVIKTIAGWEQGMPEPTDADFDGVRDMLEAILRSGVEKPLTETIRRMVREEIARQIRSQR